MPENVKIDLNDEKGFYKRLTEIKETLRRGGVIAFPTDTFYGLGVNPFHEQAVARIFEIKQRPADKPLLVLVASPDQLKTLAGEISPEAEKVMKKLWPGPLSILFDALPHLPKKLVGETGKIGVRQPGNELTRKLIEEVGYPLTAPSANFSGSKNACAVEEIDDALAARLDMIVDGGPTPGGKESTLLDTTVSPPAILREGAVSREEIESVLNVRCGTIA